MLTPFAVSIVYSFHMKKVKLTRVSLLIFVELTKSFEGKCHADCKAKLRRSKANGPLYRLDMMKTNRLTGKPG